MGIVEKLQTLAKTDLRIVRETAVTTTKSTDAPDAQGQTKPMTADLTDFLAALEAAQRGKS